MHKRRKRCQRTSRRRNLFEQLEERHLLAGPSVGTNPLQPLDVTRDGSVTPIDALRVINALNRATGSSADPADNLGSFIDVTGEGAGTAIDALRIINALNRNEPLIAATLPIDSGPADRLDLALDLITNDYAINLNVTVGDLGGQSVRMRIGGGAFSDITDQFSDGTAELTESEIDGYFGSALPDGDHPITVQIGDDGSEIDFVLTVDRDAPGLILAGGELQRVTSDSVVATFTEPIVPESVGNASPMVQRATGEALSVVGGGFEDNSIVLPLTSTLEDGDYRFTFDGAAQDFAGNTLTQFEQAFTVADPPGIDSISPADGESQVNVTRETIVRFDEPVDPSTITGDSFRVLAAGAPVSGNIRVNRTGRTATFFYDTPLPASTQVQVLLDSDAIRDAGGLRLDADGDDEPGGQRSTEFRTLPLTLIPNTVVNGFVKDSQTQAPLEGVVISLEAFPSIRATTNAEGFFELGTQDANNDGIADGLPAPDFFVFIDGSGATAPDGSSYAHLGKPFHSVPGQTIQLEDGGDTFDVFLPPIPNDARTPIVAGEETSFGFGADSLQDLAEMLPDVDPAILSQMRVVIPPDAAMNDAGEMATEAFVIPVDPDFLPAPLPPNLDPALVVSVQAPGTTNFDVPVPISFPNIEGLAPGEQTLLFSFNHDAGRFEVNGTATVSDDGMSVVSDEGVGIEAPGWHFNLSGFTLRGFLEGLQNALFDIGSALNSIGSFVGRYSPEYYTTGLSTLGSRLTGVLSVGISIGSALRDDGRIDGFEGVSIGSAVVGLASGIGIAAFCGATAGVGCAIALVGAVSAPVVGFGADLLKMNDTLKQQRETASGLQKTLAASSLKSSAEADTLNSLIDRIDVEIRENEILLDMIMQNETIVLDAFNQLFGKSLREVLPDDAPDEFIVNFSDDNTLVLSDRTGDGFRGPNTENLIIEMEQLVPLIEQDDFLATEEILGQAQALQAQAEERLRTSSTSDTRFRQLFADVASFATEESPSTDPRWFSVQVGSDVISRGRVDPNGRFDVVAPAETTAFITIVDPLNGLIGTQQRFTGPSGAPERSFPSIFLNPSEDLDSDSDGISDEIERALGTSILESDSDMDGISDLAEIEQGLDPLGGRAFPTGPVANLALQGDADEIVVRALDGAVEQAAFVATGTHGLAIADVSQFDTPILLSELALPGISIDLDVDRRTEIVALAAGASGLHLVDYSDLSQPALLRTINDHTDQLTIRDGVVYAIGDQAVRRYGISDGSLLDGTSIGQPLDDIKVDRDHIYVLTSSDLIVLNETVLGLTEIGRLAVSGSASPQTAGRRLHIDGDVAYIGTFGGYITVDVANPASLSILGSPPTTQEAIHSIATNGSGVVLPVTSFAGPGTLGLARFDGRDASDVTDFQTRFDTPGEARSAAIASGIAFVADGSRGLTVVNYLAFDSLGVAPTVTANLENSDIDPGTPGIQVNEGSLLDFDIEIRDDVQVQRAELLLDDEVIARAVAVPFDLSTIVDLLAADQTERTAQLQIRAVDTGGNATLTDPIEISIVPDTVAPTIVQLSPAEGSLRIEGFTTAIVNFSEPIQLAGLPANAIRIVNTVDNSIFIPERMIGRAAGREVLAVFPELPIGQYELVVDNVFQDASGNVLANGVTSNFTVDENTDPGETFAEAFDLGLLSGSETINGSIGIPDENGSPDPVDVFRFEVNDFQDLTFNLTGRTGGSRLFLARDANGDEIFDDLETWVFDSSTVADDLGFATSVIPGEYYTWIDSANESDATLYTFDYQVSEHTRGPVALVSGETITGALEVNGEVDFFTFDASAGDEFFMVYQDQVTSSSIDGETFVYAPDGTLVEAASVINMNTDAGFARNNVPLDQTGTYTIVLSEFNGDPIDGYSFTMVLLDDEVDADNVVLQSGMSVSGTLEGGDVDTFTFDATAGSDFFMVYQDQTTNSSFDGETFVYAPDGTLIEAASTIDVNTNSGFTRSNIALNQTGTYTIVLAEFDGSQNGDYTFTMVLVDDEADSDNVVLQSGMSVTGVLDAGDIDTFTFDASAGEEFFMVYQDQESSSSFDGQAFVFAPDGTLVLDASTIDADTDTGFARTNVALEQTGTYTIVLAELDGDQVGDYTFTVVLLDDEVDSDNVVLQSGMSVTGILDAGDIDTFTFDASAGEEFFMVYQDQTNSSTFDGETFVYAPDGTLVQAASTIDANTDTGFARTNVALDQTGTYTIVLAEFDGDQIGDYTFTVVLADDEVDSDNVVLQSGATVSGSLDAGDVDTFTFDAAAGSEFFMVYQDQTNNSAFDGETFVYAPDGTLVQAASTIDANTDTGFARTNVPLDQTGTYTIVLAEFDGSQNGDYTFTMVLVDDEVDSDNVVLQSGTPFSGTLDAGDIDTFTFDASAGDEFFMVYEDQTSSSAFDGETFVYAPDGTLVPAASTIDAETSSGFTLSNVALDQTGTYTLVLAEFDGDREGDYSFTVTLQ